MVSRDLSRLPLPLLVTLAVSCVLLLPPATARPNQGSVEKRVSDQRLAELETLLAMAVNNRRMADMNVGFGLIDPHAIGRRKRSPYPMSEALLRELSHSPAAYTSLLQLLTSYLQQQQQQDGAEQQAMQLAQLGGGVQPEYGERNPGRSVMI